MTTPSVGDGDPFPIPSGEPVSSGGKRKKLAIVGAAVGIGVAAVATVLLLGRGDDGPDGATFRPGDEFTSSDGTFTFTLPDGWADATEEYRARYAERSDGAESSIEGLAILDGSPLGFSENFMSMSGHPRMFQTRHASEIGDDKLEGWREAFDEVTDTTSGELTTDAGDEVWYGSMTGLTDDEEWRIVLVVVLGEESVGLFDLEIRPPYYAAESDLLAAIATLVFAPASDADADSGDLLWHVPHVDGRTYSSEGGASMVVPEDWAYVESPYEADAVNPEINFDYLGLWRVGGTDDLTPLEITSVSLVAGPQPNPGLTALEEVEANFGAVGETTTDVNGVEYTVQSMDSWTAVGAEDAARVTILANYDATGEPVFEGRIVTRVCYALLSGGAEVFSCLETPDELDPALVASIEDALQTLRFHN